MTKDKITPDEFFKDADFFDFLNKGSEISYKRKIISSIIEKYSKEMTEEILKSIYEDTYKEISNSFYERDYPEIVRNAFRVPTDLIKNSNGTLVYHCVNKTITLDNIRKLVNRDENDFKVYKTFSLDYELYNADSSSIIFAKADNIKGYANIDQLILSYDKENLTITVYYTKDFQNMDNIIDTILDFSNIKQYIEETDENKEDETKAQEAIKKIQEAAQKAEELIKNNVKK